MEKHNLKSKELIPLDTFLMIDNLPFKITKEMMLEMAFWGQNQTSLQSAKEMKTIRNEMERERSSIPFDIEI